MPGGRNRIPVKISARLLDSRVQFASSSPQRGWMVTLYLPSFALPHGLGTMHSWSLPLPSGICSYSSPIRNSFPSHPVCPPGSRS